MYNPRCMYEGYSSSFCGYYIVHILSYALSLRCVPSTVPLSSIVNENVDVFTVSTYAFTCTYLQMYFCLAVLGLYTCAVSPLQRDYDKAEQECQRYKTLYDAARDEVQYCMQIHAHSNYIHVHVHHTTYMY